MGRKHLKNKLSAIHRIIFNEEAEPINRDTYNEVKMNYNGSFLDRPRENSNKISKYSEKYEDRYARQEDK